MATVVFLDTSVLCEVLQLPGKSQQHESVETQLRQRIDASESLVLPTATIIETGNHVAHIDDGNSRRSSAERLAKVLRATAIGKAPWVLNASTWDGALLTKICDGARGCAPLPDMASQGIGLGDVSILAEAEAYEQRVARVTVAIWTLDNQLAAYA